MGKGEGCLGFSAVGWGAGTVELCLQHPASRAHRRHGLQALYSGEDQKFPFMSSVTRSSGHTPLPHPPFACPVAVVCSPGSFVPSLPGEDVLGGTAGIPWVPEDDNLVMESTLDEQERPADSGCPGPPAPDALDGPGAQPWSLAITA